jgi:hypothetical protein
MNHSSVTRMLVPDVPKFSDNRTALDGLRATMGEYRAKHASGRVESVTAALDLFRTMAEFCHGPATGGSIDLG